MMRRTGCTALLLTLALAAAAAGRGGVSEREIDAAIERGSKFLLEAAARGAGATAAPNLALAAYALLHSGVPPHQADLARILAAVEGFRPKRTYDAAVQILALGAAGPTRYRDRIRAAAQTLLANQKESGGFGYTPFGRADNSNSQYGLLGLWAAEEAGIEIPEPVWWRGLEHFAPAKGTAGGGTLAGGGKGWGYLGEDKPTRSMTAAALGSLHLCLERLGRLEGTLDHDREVRIRLARRRIAQGTAWLRPRLRLDVPDSGWHHYYLYGIERLGAFSASPRIGKIDWYRAGAAYLVATQRTDGGWAPYRPGRAAHRDAPPAGGRRRGRGRTAARLSASSSDEITTSFALLFLSRATAAQAGTTPGPTLSILRALGGQPQPRQIDEARRAIRRIGRRAVADLIRALSSTGPDARRLAIELLRGITGREFGFDPDRPPDANREALARWETWFLKEGIDREP